MAERQTIYARAPDSLRARMSAPRSRQLQTGRTPAQARLPESNRAASARGLAWGLSLPRRKAYGAAMRLRRSPPTKHVRRPPPRAGRSRSRGIELPRRHDRYGMRIAKRRLLRACPDLAARLLRQGVWIDR